jgi:hypothetical protein
MQQSAGTIALLKWMGCATCMRIRNVYNINGNGKSEGNRLVVVGAMLQPDVQETGWECVECIQLDQDRICWWTLGNMYIQVLQKAQNFLSSCIRLFFVEGHSVMESN